GPSSLEGTSCGAKSSLRAITSVNTSGSGKGSRSAATSTRSRSSLVCSGGASALRNPSAGPLWSEGAAGSKSATGSQSIARVPLDPTVLSDCCSSSWVLYYLDDNIRGVVCYSPLSSS